jgi:hypothetical protein
MLAALMVHLNRVSCGDNCKASLAAVTKFVCALAQWPALCSRKCVKDRCTVLYQVASDSENFSAQVSGAWLTG